MATTSDGRFIPDFFIIGATKAGTTSLHDFLDPHPDICLPRIKEPNFIVGMNAWRDWSWYARLFEDHGKVTGEASVNYTRLPRISGAAERIAADNPGARIVYSVRDPIDRLISQYMDAQFLTQERRPLSDVIADSIDPHPQDLVPMGQYARQLAPYLAAFPKEQILVLDFHELTRDPEPLLRRLVDFLGLDPAPIRSWMLPRSNVSAVKRRQNPLGRLLTPDPVRDALLAHKIGGFRMSKALIAASRFMGPVIKKPHLSEAEEETLKAYFREDVAALKAMTGLPLAQWRDYGA